MTKVFVKAPGTWQMDPINITIFDYFTAMMLDKIYRSYSSSVFFSQDLQHLNDDSKKPHSFRAALAKLRYFEELGIVVQTDKSEVLKRHYPVNTLLYQVAPEKRAMDILRLNSKIQESLDSTYMAFTVAVLDYLDKNGETRSGEKINRDLGNRRVTCLPEVFRKQKKELVSIFQREGDRAHALHYSITKDGKALLELIRNLSALLRP
jgi:hypothetical protein